jgi:uncharacterized protein YigE (DUF2233 family)
MKSAMKGLGILMKNRGLYTPPHTPVGLQVDSGGVQVDSGCTSTIFSLVVIPPNVSLE